MACLAYFSPQRGVIEGGWGQVGVSNFSEKVSILWDTMVSYYAGVEKGTILFEQCDNQNYFYSVHVPRGAVTIFPMEERV